MTLVLLLGCKEFLFLFFFFFRSISFEGLGLFFFVLSRCQFCFLFFFDKIIRNYLFFFFFFVFLVCFCLFLVCFDGLFIPYFVCIASNCFPTPLLPKPPSRGDIGTCSRGHMLLFLPRMKTKEREK